MRLQVIHEYRLHSDTQQLCTCPHFIIHSFFPEYPPPATSTCHVSEMISQNTCTPLTKPLPASPQYPAFRVADSTLPTTVTAGLLHIVAPFTSATRALHCSTSKCSKQHSAPSLQSIDLNLSYPSSQTTCPKRQSSTGSLMQEV